MRSALIHIVALGLSACETASNVGGVADYDALKKAAADCTAKGGQLVLQPGGDAENIQDYACKRT